jgi:hypothetical protein
MQLMLSIVHAPLVAVDCTHTTLLFDCAHTHTHTNFLLLLLLYTQLIDWVCALFVVDCETFVDILLEEERAKPSFVYVK